MIELDTFTITALRSWRVEQARERLLMGESYADHGLVFCRPDGTPHHPERFGREFTRRVERLDLPRIRLHDLRHTWATLALQAGVPAKVVPGAPRSLVDRDHPGPLHPCGAVDAHRRSREGGRADFRRRGVKLAEVTVGQVVAVSMGLKAKHLNVPELYDNFCGGGDPARDCRLITAMGVMVHGLPGVYPRGLSDCGTARRRGLRRAWSVDAGLWWGAVGAVQRSMSRCSRSTLTSRSGRLGRTPRAARRCRDGPGGRALLDAAPTSTRP